MGGAVKTVAQVANKTLSNINEVSNRVESNLKDVPILKELPKSAQTFRQSGMNVTSGIQSGKSLGSVVGGSAAPFVARGKDMVGQFKEGAGMDQQEAPASIVADDPAAVAADAKKKKEAARRQAEVDIMTDRPGRGGTILADNYNYKT